jgi:hypothetical protein
VRLTTYHPCSAERQEIRGLNLPGTPVGLLGLSVGVTLTIQESHQLLSSSLLPLKKIYDSQFNNSDQELPIYGPREVITRVPRITASLLPHQRWAPRVVPPLPAGHPVMRAASR